jgi:hypothetical protein
MARSKSRKAVTTLVSWETVCELARALPEADESTSYGTPAFKVGGKLFVRFHQNGHSIIVRVDDRERELLMKDDPEAFYMTDHYVGTPWVLVRLSAVRRAVLRELLEESHRRAAQGLD